MVDKLQPPRTASWMLSLIDSPHLDEILGDLMEEFTERAQQSGLAAARGWYWRETLRNMIALGRVKMTGRARPRTLLLISGAWLSIALLCALGSHAWLMQFEHQAWGVMTVGVFVGYFVLMIGWLAPLLWTLIRPTKPIQ